LGHTLPWCLLLLLIRWGPFFPGWFDTSPPPSEPSSPSPLAGISTSTTELQTKVICLFLEAPWTRAKFALPYSTAPWQHQPGGKKGLLTAFGWMLQVYSTALSSTLTYKWQGHFMTLSIGLSLL
jgi:hypothetical protein